MNIAQVVAGVIIVMSAVVSYLLAQTDVSFDPLVKVLLGAGNVALTTLALYLKVTMPGAKT